VSAVLLTDPSQFLLNHSAAAIQETDEHGQKRTVAEYGYFSTMSLHRGTAEHRFYTPLAAILNQGDPAAFGIHAASKNQFHIGTF
jgi:hypothetical protein